MTLQLKASELIVVDGMIYHLGLRRGELAEQIIVVGDPARADMVADHFDSIRVRKDNREYRTRTGEYRGMPVSVVSTGIGTDNNEIALVECFGLHGFDLEQRVRNPQMPRLTLVRVGTSGGLQKDIDVGTLAISQFALGLDNTGLFYDVNGSDACTRLEDAAYNLITQNTPPDKRFRGKIFPYASQATPEVVGSLVNHARGLYAVGITASASGFYGPQGREIPGLPITVPSLQEHLAGLVVEGNRVINFEMESSLLFHLAKGIGMRVGTICPIIANRPAGTFLSDYKPAVERAIETALSAMHAMYAKNRES